MTNVNITLPSRKYPYLMFVFTEGYAVFMSFTLWKLQKFEIYYDIYQKYFACSYNILCQTIMMVDS